MGYFASFLPLFEKTEGKSFYADWVSWEGEKICMKDVEQGKGAL